MFRNNLQARFERIFGMVKTTFLAYDLEAPEQDTLFIEILEARTRVVGKDGGRVVAKVSGTVVVFSQDNRLPFGFFGKRVENASPADTRDLYFFNFDYDDPHSPGRIQNIHERRTSFVFLYDSQYDPEQGSLTSLTLDPEA